MKNSTQKSIKRLSIATLIIGGLTLAYLYWEMIAHCGGVVTFIL